MCVQGLKVYYVSHYTPPNINFMLLKCYIYRCSYHYDALGNLYKKTCSDSTSFRYLVDPFGQFGADIIAEVWLVLHGYLVFSVGLN